MRQRIFIASLMALAVSAVFAYSAEPKPLSRLFFLIGTWSAEGGGTPGQAAGSFSFAEDLNGRVLIRKNHAQYPNAVHDDLMVIYPEGDKLRADYYDTEGHVIRYTVTTPAPNRAVFVSDAVAGAPRFRLSYEAPAPGQLNGTFEIAPPDKPEAYSKYLSWKSRNSALSQ